MKKLISIGFTIISIILLCGCGGDTDIKPKLRDISFTADISYYNENYTLDATISNDGVMVAKVLYPQDLKDMQLTFSENGTTVDYKGLTYTPKSGKLPLGDVSQTLYDIISDLDKSQKDIITNGENSTVNGKTENKIKYNFIFSPSGLPLKIKIPDDSFTIVFKNVTLNQNSQAP